MKVELSITEFDVVLHMISHAIEKKQKKAAKALKAAGKSLNEPDALTEHAENAESLAIDISILMGISDKMEIAKKNNLRPSLWPSMEIDVKKLEESFRKFLENQKSPYQALMKMDEDKIIKAFLGKKD